LCSDLYFPDLYTKTCYKTKNGHMLTQTKDILEIYKNNKNYYKISSTAKTIVQTSTSPKKMNKSYNFIPEHLDISGPCLDSNSDMYTSIQSQLSECSSGYNTSSETDEELDCLSNSKIPIVDASEENLSFYDAEKYNPGDVVDLGKKKEQQNMYFTENIIKNCEGRQSETFLEQKTIPQLYLNQNMSNKILLGKICKNKNFKFTIFKIQPTTAIIIRPGCLFSEKYLHGKINILSGYDDGAVIRKLVEY
jgi:hypothetical protein